MAAARLNSRFSESIDHFFFWLSAQNMRCRNTLVNFRRKLRLQLLDLAVEALDGLLVRGFLFLALADSAHQLFDLVRRVACGALPAVAERHLRFQIK